MPFKIFSLVCVLLVYISLMPVINGQIPIELIPPELRFVLDPELEKWTAPEQLEKECPYYLSGFDEENRPIWVIEMGVWPTRAILDRGQEWEVAYEKYVKKGIQKIFNSVKIRATPENPVTAINLIVDLDQYTIKHFSSLKAAKFVTRMFQLVVGAAEAANVMYVVNANFFAEAVINILRPVLGSALERVDIFGTNSNTWIPKLLKLLPRDQLHKKYGGNKDFKPVQVYG